MRNYFVAIAAFCQVAQALTVENDLEITSGIIYGIGLQENLTNLDACMHDSEIFVDEIVKGTEWIIEWDLRSVIVGTRAIARAVRSLPEYLDTCESSGSDLHAFEQWAKIFLEPVNLVRTIAGNAVSHPAKVAFDIEKTKRAFDHAEYFQFGSDIG